MEHCTNTCTNKCGALKGTTSKPPPLAYISRGKFFSQKFAVGTGRGFYVGHGAGFIVAQGHHMAPGMDSFKSPCSPVTSSCLIFETFTFLCTAGHRARFSVAQVYAKGSRSGSLKRPRMGLPIGCQLIPALNCLVFLRKPLFRRQTNTRTDRRTDRQANRRTTSLRTASAFASRGLMIGQARYKLSGGPYIVSVVSLQWSRLWDVNSHQTLC